MNNITFITPTYSQDIERFSLLRKSIDIFAENIKHIAIVQTEHLALFRERFEKSSNLELVPTSEVLPKKLESIRRLHGTLIWKIIERGAWRLFLDPNVVRGWKVQQLTKIHALSTISQDAAVFLDSDCLLIKDTTADDYFADNKTILLESLAANGEDIALDIATYLLAKIPLNTVSTFRNYVHVGATFNKATAKLLIKELSRLNNNNFESAFLQHQLPSEYNMLGFVARNIEKYAGYAPCKSDPRELTVDIRYKEDIGKFDKTFNRIDTKQNERYFLFQSNLGINASEYKKQLLARVSKG